MTHISAMTKEQYRAAVVELCIDIKGGITKILSSTGIKTLYEFGSEEIRKEAIASPHPHPDSRTLYRAVIVMHDKERVAATAWSYEDLCELIAALFEEKLSAV